MPESILDGRVNLDMRHRNKENKIKNKDNII